MSETKALEKMPDSWRQFVKDDLTAVTAPVVTAEQLELIRRTVAKDATPDELKLYLYDCARQGVHPLDKLIHFTKRGGKYTPVTSIDFMRTRAADSGEYAGNDDAVFANTSGEASMTATVTVWRLVGGQRCAFTATARFAEYKPEANDFMWKRMPHTMLGKCAEALALRKGFPRQLAGLYAREEMDQAEAPRVTNGARPDPPETLVDVATGEDVPSTAMPTPPKGYEYIQGCVLSDNQWYEVRLLNHGGTGTTKYSTKLQKLGAVAMQAYQDGVPVKITGKPAKRAGDFYLDSIVTWKPIADERDARTEPAAFDDEIPF